MNTLYQTYENNIHMAGKAGEDNTLSPVAHMNANAQIEITIDEDGNFIEAAAIDREQARTLIPVSEKSAGRSSGVAPHALSDTLSYIAGDYSQYVDDKAAEKAEEKFSQYVQGLKKWSESSYSNPKVKAVYQYISRKQVIKNLLDVGVLEQAEKDKFANKKIKGAAYEKALVRFRVLSTGKNVSAAWEDSDLIAAYIN